MAGAVVFVAASLFCAAAPSIPVLIGGRALTGVGAAMLLPASLAIIRVVWVDMQERGKALGMAELRAARSARGRHRLATDGPPLRPRLAVFRRADGQDGNATDVGRRRGRHRHRPVAN